MHEHGSDSDGVGGLLGTQQRILQQRNPKPLALGRERDREARKHDNANRMSGKPRPIRSGASSRLTLPATKA